MTITHVTALRNTLADAVVDAIDVGTTDPSGDIEIAVDSGFTQVASTIDFDTPPAFGAASGGTATANGVPLEDSPAAGHASPVAFFRTRNRDNAEVFRGSVTDLTPGGGDMELSSDTINAGDAVRINSFTYSAPV